MMKQLLRATPFLILSIIAIYTWYIFLTTEYVAALRHIIALVLIVVNLVLYFIRFVPAILLTGGILVLATFNLLGLFPEIVAQSFGINIASVNLSTPKIQWEPLLILALYFVINFDYLSNVYLDYKETRRPK